MTRNRARAADRAARAWRAGTVAAALATGLLASSCSASSTAPTAARTVHTEDEGPLSASIGAGGNSMLAPDDAPWTGTFGGFVLCSTQPGARLEVQRLRYRASVAPVRVLPTVRITSPGSVRDLPPARRQDYLPTYAALGSPPRFAEPYAEVAVPGDYSTRVRGWRVEQSCEETAALERQLSTGRALTGPLKELMFVVTSGPRGARIDRVDVDYLADGRPMTLALHWAMVSCGTDTVGPDVCRTH